MPEHPANTSDPSTEVTIPGTPEQAADSVEAVSVEGRPADAKSGPATLRIELALFALVVAGGAILVGVWFGAVAGVAAFALGCLSLLVNPEVAATLLRTRDRTEAIERTEGRSGPDDRPRIAR